MTTTAHPFLTAALACAARGWPVIPLRPGTKKPAFHGYDRCPRTGPCATGHQPWEQRALTDTDQVRWYWSSRRGRGCNIGVAVGRAGLLGVDLDIPKPGDAPPFAPWNRPDVHTGEDVFLLLCDQAGVLPPVDTLTVTTASGGTHLYYTAPDGVALGNTVGTRAGAGLGWKIDTRGHGGLLVGPGSVVDGRPYRVALDTAPIPLPGWLTQRLTALAAPAPRTAGPVTVRNGSAYVKAAVRDTVAQVMATRVSRNAALYGAAVSLGRFVAEGQLSEREHAEALMDAASGHIAVRAYSAQQAARTITSGLRNALRRSGQAAA